MGKASIVPSCNQTNLWLTGYYMYLEASPLVPGQSARLLSRPLRGSRQPQCLSFYYHMYGSGTGQLSVHLDKDGDDVLLWQRSGEQSIAWLRATVDFQCDSQHQASGSQPLTILKLDMGGKTIMATGSCTSRGRTVLTITFVRLQLMIIFASDLLDYFLVICVLYKMQIFTFKKLETEKAQYFLPDKYPNWFI